MSRKHFTAIAAIFANNKPQLELLTSKKTFDALTSRWLRDCRAIADICQSTNNRFDRTRFLSACGVE